MTLTSPRLRTVAGRARPAPGPRFARAGINLFYLPALVLVGFLMMQQVADISWADLEIAIPAFLTIVLMPFTYSITAGIGAGFIVHVLIKVVRGKARDVHGLMWVVAVLFVFYFAIEPIRRVLGVE